MNEYQRDELGDTMIGGITLRIHLHFVGARAETRVRAVSVQRSAIKGHRLVEEMNGMQAEGKIEGRNVDMSTLQHLPVRRHRFP
jgi:hypothetical protein